MCSTEPIKKEKGPNVCLLKEGKRKFYIMGNAYIKRKGELGVKEKDSCSEV